MKKILKNNYKFILTIIITLIILSIRFPYYIDAPGGIEDMQNKIEINGYKSEGSLNLAFVREYRATIPTLIISLFNKDFKVIKEDQVLLEDEEIEEYNLRDKILMEESISNAIFVAYTYSNSNIEIKSNKLYVSYVTKESNTSIKVGDEIQKIDNVSISNKNELKELVNSKKVNDKITLVVKNKDKYYERYAYIYEEDGKKIIGVLVSELTSYETDPKVNVKIENDESGPSGGLITALSIYNALTKEDITKKLKIVGTGTIDKDGSVGSIGGVEYKLKSAVKAHADIFLVPQDENYETAIKLKEKYKYDIKIYGVSTFEDAINILKSIDNK